MMHLPVLKYMGLSLINKIICYGQVFFIPELVITRITALTTEDLFLVLGPINQSFSNFSCSIVMICLIFSSLSSTPVILLSLHAYMTLSPCPKSLRQMKIALSSARSYGTASLAPTDGVDCLLGLNDALNCSIHVEYAGMWQQLATDVSSMSRKCLGNQTSQSVPTFNQCIMSLISDIQARDYLRSGEGRMLYSPSRNQAAHH